MKIKAILFSLLVCFTVFSQQPPISLVNNGHSEYKIIIPRNASYWDSLAATDLQKYIEEISSVKIPVVSDSVAGGEYELVIGNNSHSGNLDISAIKEDGFIIRTDKNKIYFAGGGKKGTLNAIYTFLENYLGCRMYSI